MEKNAVKGVIHHCVACSKCKPSVYSPIMGNLSQARLIPVRPFTNVGCDFAGPNMIKDGTDWSASIRRHYNKNKQAQLVQKTLLAAMGSRIFNISAIQTKGKDW